MFEPYISYLTPQVISKPDEFKFFDEPLELVSPNAEASGKVFIFSRTDKKLIVSDKGSVKKLEWDVILSKNSLLFECEGINTLFNYIYSDKNMVILKKDTESEYMLFCNQNYFKSIEFTSVALYINSLSKAKKDHETKIKPVVEVYSTHGISFIKEHRTDTERAELSKKKKKYSYIDFINSAIINVFWLLFYFLLNLAVTKIMISFLGFDAHFDNLKFTIQHVTNDVLWDNYAKVLIYGPAPIISMLAAIVFQYLHKYFDSRTGTSKLFFLWGYLYGFGFLLGSYIAGSNTSSWFGLFVDALRIPGIIKIVIFIIAIAGLLSFGYLANNLFINTTWSRRFVESPYQQFVYKLRVVWGPYSAALLISLLYSFFTKDYYWAIVHLSMILLVIPSVLIINTKNRSFVYEHKIQSVSILYISITVLLLVVLFFWSVV